MVERKSKSSSGGGGVGTLIALGIGALVGAAVTYFANKATAENE